MRALLVTIVIALAFQAVDASRGEAFGECLFLLLDCKDPPQIVRQGERPGSSELPSPTCTRGNHVIVNVPWKDADNGLLVRAGPSTQAAIVSVIPANGVGIAVSNCSDGWCRVDYNCQKGWASSKYLAELPTQLRNVTKVSPSDPDGLNVRTGPGTDFARINSIPYNGREIVVHNCQTVLQASWCLVTYQQKSGWVAGRYLSF